MTQLTPTGGGKTFLASALGIAACHNEHDVHYAPMDDLARRLVIARADGIAHQDFLITLATTDLLIIDDFLTVGIDPDAASDLFAILASREHRRPTVIISQTEPDYWAQALPDRVAADSIVNRLANNARRISLGDIDMRRERNNQARADDNYWEKTPPVAGNPALPGRRNTATKNPDSRYQQALRAIEGRLGKIPAIHRN